jgi:hypothetical protein
LPRALGELVAVVPIVLTAGCAPLTSDTIGHVRRPPHLRLCRLLPALVSP